MEPFLDFFPCRSRLDVVRTQIMAIDLYFLPPQPSTSISFSLDLKCQMNDDRVDQRGSIFIIVNLFLKQEGRKSLHESKRKETEKKEKEQGKRVEREREISKRDRKKLTGKEGNERPDFVLFFTFLDWTPTLNQKSKKKVGKWSCERLDLIKKFLIKEDMNKYIECVG